MISIDLWDHNYYDNKAGMTLPADRAALVALAAGHRRVLEIGINEGGTAQLLLRNCSTIDSYVGIDVPYGFATALNAQRREVPQIAGRLVYEDPRVKIILKPTQDIDPLEVGPCDFAFIDADHSKAGVERDTFLARRCIRRGTIVWHDYRNSGEEPTEVNHVLDRWVDDGVPIIHINGTWLAYERVVYADT